MKKLFRSGLALLLAAFLVMPAFAAELEERSGAFAENGLAEEGEIFTFSQPRRTRSLLPERYDAREAGDITGVKNQGGQEMCWAFGTLGAMEANMLKNGLGEQDLSEQHLYYATATGGGNAYGFARSGKMGNRVIAAAYLMRGVQHGAASEENDPYTQALPARDAAETAAIAPAYRAQNLLLLSGGSEKAPAATLKQAIMTYGAVGASMYWKGATTTNAAGVSTAYYNAATAAYYCNEASTVNHMVLLIGWDDAFPAEAFHDSCRPEADGAWLVKNSWGEGWGEDGFFWISYEDVNSPAGAFVIDGVTPYNARELVYETEYLTTTSSLAGVSKYAKVFSVQSDGELLTAVRVYLSDAETELTVSVCMDGIETAQEPVAQATIVAATPGWYTIPLSEPLPLGAAGSTFHVRAELSDSGKHVGVDKLTPNPAGQNYYFSSKSGWSSLDSTSYNLAIKALALRAPLRGDANGDGTVSGKDVTQLRRYFAGGYGVTIDEEAADANGDGTVNGKDVTILRRYLAGGYGVTLGEAAQSTEPSTPAGDSTPWVPMS